MEKWTLSDPGRLGSEAHRPALFAGRESYDPGGGRSGYFRPVSGSAPEGSRVSAVCTCWSTGLIVSWLPRVWSSEIRRVSIFGVFLSRG